MQWPKPMTESWQPRDSVSEPDSCMGTQQLPRNVWPLGGYWAIPSLNVLTSEMGMLIVTAS